MHTGVNLGSTGSGQRVRRGQVGQVIVGSANSSGGDRRIGVVTREVHTEQWVRRVSFGRRSSRGILREVHKVAATSGSTANRRHSRQSSGSASERGRLGHVDDVPVTHQTGSRRIQTQATGSSLGGDVGQRCIQHGRRARCGAAYVLDSRVQRAVGIAIGTVHHRAVDVSHVENFNVAFTGLGSDFTSLVAQTIGHERLWNTLCQRR